MSKLGENRLGFDWSVGSRTRRADNLEGNCCYQAISLIDPLTLNERYGDVTPVIGKHPFPCGNHPRPLPSMARVVIRNQVDFSWRECKSDFPLSRKS